MGDYDNINPADIRFFEPPEEDEVVVTPTDTGQWEIDPTDAPDDEVVVDDVEDVVSYLEGLDGN